MFSRRVIWFWSFLSISAFLSGADAQQTPGDIRDAALVVGNLGFSSTDGILRYDWRGTFVDNVVPAGSGGLAGPCCMTFGPDENLYVSSPPTGAVLRFNGFTGSFIDTFIPAGRGGLQFPLMLLFREGYLYVGDTGAGAIRRYDANTGSYVDSFVPDNSQAIGGFADLQQFAFGPDHKLYVTAEISKRVLRYDGQTGAYLDDLVPNNAGFSPSGLTFGPNGLLYIGSFASGEVRRYDVFTRSYEVVIPGGSFGVAGPVGLTFGPDTKLYVAAAGPIGAGYASSAIFRYDTTARSLQAFVPPGGSVLSGPRAITWKIKTTVCHAPAGDPYKAKTLTIGYLSAGDHLRHGDTLGPCH